MVHFPVRKCLQTVRLCILVLLVVVILVTVDRWLIRPVFIVFRTPTPPGRHAVTESYPLEKLRRPSQVTDPVEAAYERQMAEDEARIVPGLGEGGAPANLTGRDRELGEQSEKKLSMNVYLSDRVAYNRSLEDQRNPACKKLVYDAELPSVSVIIVFHNEPYSMLVRTIWSVVTSARRDRPWFRHANYLDRKTGRNMTLGYPGQDPRSPLVYLKEIILVDDNSTLPELKGKLSYYVRTRFPPDLIRILRLLEREGLTRARLTGARVASGSVLVFLDAHCEGQPDWLRPLLQRIKDVPHTVVTPIINTIDKSTLSYKIINKDFQVGGFLFGGVFIWIEVSDREKKRRGSDIAPTWSPTMAGGLFAINRDYFWELGSYDEQMRGWGGENLEMSFRIWQCGGTLETIPCSLVGHMFRNNKSFRLPYTYDTHGINTARMAEVWMDDYKELFYLHRPELRNNSMIGDVTHRKILREKLQCKSFEWYLQHVYREKFVPVRDAFGYGRFRNEASGKCLDNLQVFSSSTPLGVYRCHGHTNKFSRTQHYTLTRTGQLREEQRCAVPDLPTNKKKQSGGNGTGTDIDVRVMLQPCNKYKDTQKWIYLGNKQLVHWQSGLCLEAAATAAARRCGRQATQRWDIDYSELNHFRLQPDKEPSELEKTLMKLHKQGNISQSL